MKTRIFTIALGLIIFPTAVFAQYNSDDSYARSQQIEQQQQEIQQQQQQEQQIQQQQEQIQQQQAQQQQQMQDMQNSREHYNPPVNPLGNQTLGGPNQRLGD